MVISACSSEKSFTMDLRGRKKQEPILSRGQFPVQAALQQQQQKQLTIPTSESGKSENEGNGDIPIIDCTQDVRILIPKPGVDSEPENDSDDDDNKTDNDRLEKNIREFFVVELHDEVMNELGLDSRTISKTCFGLETLQNTDAYGEFEEYMECEVLVPIHNDASDDETMAGIENPQAKPFSSGRGHIPSASDAFEPPTDHTLAEDDSADQDQVETQSSKWVVIFVSDGSENP